MILKTKKTSKRNLSDDLADVLSTTWLPWSRDKPYSTMEKIDKRLLPICEGATAYLLGNYERTIQCYEQTEGDDAVRLAACSLTIAASISTGNFTFYKEIETFLKSLIRAKISDSVTAFSELSLASAYLGAMVPSMVPKWLKDGNFSALPTQAKPDASYKRVRYFQCKGDYKSMLNVAETALTFFDSPQKNSFPGSYLKIMCAVACNALNRLEDGKRWLLDTMNVNLPYGFISFYTELIPFCCGMMEPLIKQNYPVYYDIIIKQWKHIGPNWLAFHNKFTKDNIQSILTLREYHIAKLAAQHMPYKEIAERFSISVGRLKNIMHTIYGKLLVKNRDELAKCIL